LWHVKDR